LYCQTKRKYPEKNQDYKIQKSEKPKSKPEEKLKVHLKNPIQIHRRT
jgi:hypothetical protein